MGVMKVCLITPKNADTTIDTHLPQFHIHIQTALEHITQLFPFKEIDCLEEIIAAYDLPDDVEKKE